MVKQVKVKLGKLRISSTNTEQQRISLDNPNTRDFHFFPNLRSSVESFSLLLWVFFCVHMFLFKLSITNFVTWSLPFFSDMFLFIRLYFCLFSTISPVDIGFSVSEPKINATVSEDLELNTVQLIIFFNRAVWYILFLYSNCWTDKSSKNNIFIPTNFK